MRIFGLSCGCCLAVLCLVPIGFISVWADSGIPSWIRDNAGLWVDGEIDDNAFLVGIKFLIDIGVIPLNQSEYIQDLQDENEALRADLLLVPGYKTVEELRDTIEELEGAIEEKDQRIKELEDEKLQASLRHHSAEDYIESGACDCPDDSAPYLEIIKCGVDEYGYVEVKYGIYSNIDYDFLKTQILLKDSSGNVIDAIDDRIDLRAGMTVYSDRLLDYSPRFDSCAVQVVG